MKLLVRLQTQTDMQHVILSLPAVETSKRDFILRRRKETLPPPQRSEASLAPFPLPLPLPHSDYYSLCHVCQDYVWKISKGFFR